MVAIKAFFSSLPPWTGVALVATSSSLLVLLSIFLRPATRLAFVGNSFMYVNDLPRVFETMNPSIVQESCLHGGLSLSSILRKGNGMYKRWGTEIHAKRTDDGHIIQDFGMCTVRQLLTGYDPNLVVNNTNKYYKSKKKNPCFRDETYFQRQANSIVRNPVYDFVILNDQSRRPALDDRSRTIKSLRKRYAPWFRKMKHTRPVLMATHGYDNYLAEKYDMGSVPNFTSRVYAGYMAYADLLAEKLPHHRPLVAPTGLAFLEIYDTNYTLWERLFYTDGFHPAPGGTYLMACVLYATLFGKMPSNKFVERSEDLFVNSRRLFISDADQPYPTADEMRTLNDACMKVGVKGKFPDSFIEESVFYSG